MSTKNQKRRERLLKKREQSNVEPSNTEQLPALEPVADKQLAKEDYGVPRAQVVKKANEVWAVLKKYATTNLEFRDMKENDKLELFRTKFGYSMFMEEFPIVARYMICYGQYSSKAFDRMLKKIEITVHPPPDKRDKGYMEDQWVKRQADYVQYLWEAYQKTHYNQAERNWIWQSTYERLRKEFDDFKNMHKEIEEKVKLEKKELAGQNARDLLERVVSGKQNLLPEEEEALLAELEALIGRRNEPEPEEFNPHKEQKILMIETVDADRMGEIDDQYKPEELRGMVPDYDCDEVIAEEVIDDTPCTFNAEKSLDVVVSNCLTEIELD